MSEKRKVGKGKTRVTEEPEPEGLETRSGARQHAKRWQHDVGKRGLRRGAGDRCRKVVIALCDSEGVGDPARSWEGRSRGVVGREVKG